MDRRHFLKTTAAVTTSTLLPSAGMASQPVLAESHTSPRPTPQQAQWQDLELGMFFHFDIPIYKPGWNWRSWQDMPQPEMYNPRKLDTDQWMEAAQAMGAKYAVFVAKHCSGFLQWQSALVETKEIAL